MAKSYLDQENKKFLAYCLANNLLSQDLISSAKQANLTYQDCFNLIRYKITGAAGKINIVSASTLQREGISDFNSGRLRDNLAMILKAIVVGHATGISGQTEGNVEYKYTHNTAPTALLNAQIEITQGSKTLKRLPITMLMCGETSRCPIGMESDFELENWEIIAGDMPVEISLVFPEGVNVGGAPGMTEHYVEVMLRGSSLVRKNK